MTVFVPPFSWAYCSDNLGSSLPWGTNGVQVSAGANNTDSSPVTLLSALSHDVHYLVMAFWGYNVNGGNAQTLADILIDRAGGTSWSSFIDDLAVGFTLSIGSNDRAPDVWLHFPLYIPAGASLGARARTRHTAQVDGRCLVYAFGGPSRPDAWWCGQGVESLGINASVSQGTSVMPGASSAWGSWTDIGAPTTYRYGALQLAVQGSDETAQTSQHQWQVGMNGTKIAGTPTFLHGLSSNETSGRMGFQIPLFCDIPAGTQLQVRGRASLASPEAINLALYGVY